jgi:hypothetical protein
MLLRDQSVPTNNDGWVPTSQLPGARLPLPNILLS